MKLSFRRDAAAGLAKAKAALAAAETKIAELEQERQTALAESDALEPVHVLDKAISEQRAAAATYADRVAVLKSAVRAQQVDRLEKERNAAADVVEQKGAGLIEAAKRAEHHARAFAAALEELYGGWHTTFPSDFQDQRGLKREVETFWFALGKPAAFREPFVPTPRAPIAVEGLAPVGVVAYVTAAIGGAVARRRATPIQIDDDEGEAA